MPSPVDVATQDAHSMGRVTYVLATIQRANHTAACASACAPHCSLMIALMAWP
eukprot:CAMPEP_0119415900 /NCGR_PEP_ID=MMETSP1335-20130426/10987_1 /TAXON_ID=259385 /ORGANISM="Chrysoculter rhomboideus, Strain RCC1486" /LENGTH=52 /DNA_ID=CAMNT_0007440961 /DNA_START=30 /DNA_END=184 /DNA_ORIENTATION=-